MQLQKRIKIIAEARYPINLGDVPGKPPDCRIKVARQEMLRQKATLEIFEGCAKIIAANQHKTPEEIELSINQFLDAESN